MINRRTFLEISAKAVAVIAVVTATPSSAHTFIGGTLKKQSLIGEWKPFVFGDWLPTQDPFSHISPKDIAVIWERTIEHNGVDIKDITHVSYHKNHPNPGHKFAPPHRPSQKYFHVWEAQILCPIKT